MTELRQKYLFNSKTFSLTKTGIKVVSKAIHENFEYVVKYEELGFDIIKKRVKTAIVPAIFLALFFFLELYLLINAIIDKERTAIIVMWLGSSVLFGILAGMAFYSSNKDVIYLTGGSKNLELMRNKPSGAEVDSFIEQVHQNMRSFYKTKYALVEKHLPYENQLHRFNWLREIEVITNEEFEALVLQLQKTPTSGIGFRTDY